MADDSLRTPLRNVTFGEELVQVDGALPPADERALRPLEGVLVEPGVRLDDAELGAAVVPSVPRRVPLAVVRVATNLKGV